MTEEKVKIWLQHEEPKNGAKDGSDEKGRVDTEGIYSEGWADDDRYKRGAADSDISKSGGGMSMEAGGSSSKLDAY